MKIKEFKDEFAFLSNFYESPMVIDRTFYKTVEHYFQSKKALKAKERIEIASARTPGEAKRLGKKCLMRSDWIEVKDDVMKKGLREKFDQNLKLLKMLIGTGEAVLEEGNSWGDKYWGKDIFTGEGKNMLGKLLMEVREEYSSK